jgi:hypothetical protein
MEIPDGWKWFAAPLHQIIPVGVSMLRLKMVVNTVKRCADQSGEISSEEITMSAVTSSKEGSANSQWSKWTPCGSLSFHVNNQAALGKVLPGQFYYVDLVPTDKDSL